MGVPIPEIEGVVEDATAAALLDSLRTISAGERRKHATVFNYWLSIRRDRDFPPIRDLDPLEISDAGPFSLLLEMIGGGEDAEIRHIGQSIKGGINAEKISDAPNPSLLSCVAARLPVVAACREAFAFEDSFDSPTGKTKCWVTLLPFSATGTWIDYVYGFVSLHPSPDAVDEAPEPDIPDCIKPTPSEPEAVEEPDAHEEAFAPHAEEAEPDPEPVQELAPEPEPEPEPEITAEAPEPEYEPDREPAPAASRGKPGFSAKFFESLASVGGFYGKNVAVEPNLPPIEFEEEEPFEPVVDEQPGPLVEEEPEPAPAVEEQPAAIVEEEPVEIVEDAPVAEEAPAAEEEPVAVKVPTEPEIELVAETPAETISPPSATSEGTLNSKLTEVRAKADEARQAKLRANAALYEGLSAAYDFALDAEEAPEEYLKLVEAQGLKIQLRSPMKPVVKLAFDGMCDDSTIKQLEAILAWAFDQELPRGTLAERIESEGGIAPILSRAA